MDTIIDGLVLYITSIALALVGVLENRQTENALGLCLS